MVDTARNNPVSDSIAMVVVFLMAIGTVFVFSAGANIGQEFDLERFYDYPGLRQILFFPLACLVMYGVSRCDYRRLSLARGWWRNPTSYLLVLSIVLLAVVLSQRFYPTLPNLVPKINQHYRWLRIPAGPIAVSFQPSELAKWAVIFFLAAVCDKLGDQIRSYWKRFVPICLVVGLVVALVIVEDFGTAAFIALLAFLMLVIAGVKWWHVLTPMPFGAVAFFFMLVRSPTRMKRIAAFIRPEQWTDSAAYQANQSLIALGSGGLWGKGLGRGICKYGHLPEDTTDFIFAIIGEELGFIGNAAVILLFIAFVALGILVVVRCRDQFGRLLAGGIVLAIAIQAALNIGVATVVLPTKGIPLPFVSAGGTSMLLSAAAIGVLLNIAKSGPADLTGSEHPGEQ
ncbi:MAG: cell division protein FtsW [Phycisphaerales bacterium]|nr:MAG: cell division protein FtsW [Phycisphaerales bacterium]